MTTTTPGAPPPAIADPLPRFLARAVPLVAAGWLLGGWVGLVAAAAGAASTFRRPATLVAAGAPVMLVVAALATVIEVPVDDASLRSSFASDRPTAASAGLIAALFALTAVVTLAVRDRAPVPAPGAVPPDAEVGEASPTGLAGLREQAGALAPVLGVVAATGVALALLAPAPPIATRAVAENVRLGVGWGRSVEGSITLDATEPPMAVVVAAVAPGGSRVWTALAGAAAVGAVAALVARRRPRRNALLAAGAVGLGLVVVRADLAAALAAASVASALLAGDPRERRPARAAAAGVAFGFGVLALPVLAVAGPVVVAALVFHPRTRAVTVLDGLAGLAAAALVVTPWQRWVIERASTWAPAAELTVPRPGVLAVLVVLAGVTLPLAASRRPAPAA